MRKQADMCLIVVMQLLNNRYRFIIWHGIDGTFFVILFIMDQDFLSVHIFKKRE